MVKYIAAPVTTEWGTFQPGEEVMYVGTSGHISDVGRGVLLGYYPEVRKRATNRLETVTRRGKMVWSDERGGSVWDPNIEYTVQQKATEDYIFHIPAVRVIGRRYTWQREQHIARLPLGRIFKAE